MDLLPHESLEDWVSYADAVVVLEVTREAEVPPLPSEVAAGEGAIMRTVTVAPQQTLWSREGAPEPPPSFEFVTWGWAFEGDDRTPMGQPGGTRLERGGRYVVPIARLEGDGWAPIAPDVTFRWSDGEARTTGVPEGVPAAAAVDDRSGAEITAALTATEPDPLALAHFDLGPVARYQAVARDRRAAD